jgi:hypothetical protein
MVLFGTPFAMHKSWKAVALYSGTEADMTTSINAENVGASEKSREPSLSSGNHQTGDLSINVGGNMAWNQAALQLTWTQMMQQAQESTLHPNT